MRPIGIATELARHYFTGPEFESRVFDDAADVSVLLAMVRGTKRESVVGLRFLDFPRMPPTLRLWSTSRWTEQNYDFDFTGSGDPGIGTTQTKAGVHTFCIRYHVDYYKDGWHSDCPWISEQAEEHLADLISNLLGGGHYF